MPYTAAACPNCKSRMSGTSGNKNNAIPLEMSKTTTGCFIATIIILILTSIFCLLGNSESDINNCEKERLKENQRRYNQAQQDPNYNPTYVPPCE